MITRLAKILEERKSAKLIKKMARDWDLRARENAHFYIATQRKDWSNEDFFYSGEKAVAEEVVADLENVCQGKDPRAMRVLEIGCGVGRITRALADLFREVHAVDVSGEMILRAREALIDKPNVHLYQNNGRDLDVVPRLEFDFAYSSIVFQHIPSRQVIESYVREVHALLRPGALFKFQVQGIAGKSGAFDTWHGVSFSEEEARSMAERNGFEARKLSTSMRQYRDLIKEFLSAVV